MGNIVITINSKTDFDLLAALIKRLGLHAFELTESDMRLLARRRLAAIVDTFPSSDDMTEEEIKAEVELVRAARHAGDSI